MEKIDKKNILIYLLFFIIIIILLYLLINNFGSIENNGPHVPTGNVDIFEIDCSCISCDKPDDVQKTIDAINVGKIVDNSNTISTDVKSNEYSKENKNTVSEQVSDSNKNESNNNNNNNEEEEDEQVVSTDITVTDDYKTWDNKELRIFSNPAFEYENKIAPGSMNSYAFVIRNNNDFDIDVDIVFKETNDKNINMLYKLRNQDNYLIGNEDNYSSINNKKIEHIHLSSKESKSYILDWKWVDADNDTLIGFDVNASYKLSIIIGVN